MQIKVKKDTYDDLATDVKSLTGKMKDASSGLSNPEIEAEIAKLKKEVGSLTKQMEPYKTAGRKLITQVEITKAEA